MNKIEAPYINIFPTTWKNPTETAFPLPIGIQEDNSYTLTIGKEKNLNFMVSNTTLGLIQCTLQVDGVDVPLSKSPPYSFLLAEREAEKVPPIVISVMQRFVENHRILTIQTTERTYPLPVEHNPVLFQFETQEMTKKNDVVRPIGTRAAITQILCTFE